MWSYPCWQKTCCHTTVSSFRRITAIIILCVSRETCSAIFSVLKDLYLKPTSSNDDWKNIEKDIRDYWYILHVVGAIDGKHIRIQCPKKTGTLYHNYKGFFHLVLLVICDAWYCFTLFDVAQHGSNNDCSVLNNSEMGHRF